MSCPLRQAAVLLGLSPSSAASPSHRTSGPLRAGSWARVPERRGWTGLRLGCACGDAAGTPAIGRVASPGAEGPASRGRLGKRAVGGKRRVGPLSGPLFSARTPPVCASSPEPPLSMPGGAGARTAPQRWQKRVETRRLTECGARGVWGANAPLRALPHSVPPVSPGLRQKSGRLPLTLHLPIPRKRGRLVFCPLPHVGLGSQATPSGWTCAAASARPSGKTSPPGET